MTRIDAEGILAAGNPLTGSDHAAIHAHYLDRLTRYAAAQGASEPEAVANVALHEGFAAYARSPLVAEPAFRSYLYRVVRSRTIDEGRVSRPELTKLEDNVSAEPDIAEAVIDEMWIRSMVDELPPDQRRVIAGRFYDGLSASELGKRLGKDSNTIHQLQHRGIVGLRQAMLAAPLRRA